MSSSVLGPRLGPAYAGNLASGGAGCPDPAHGQPCQVQTGTEHHPHLHSELDKMRTDNRMMWVINITLFPFKLTNFPSKDLHDPDPLHNLQMSIPKTKLRRFRFRLSNIKVSSEVNIHIHSYC